MDEKRLWVLGGFLAATVVIALVMSESGGGSRCLDDACPEFAAASGYADLVGVSQTVTMDLPAEMRQRNWGGGSCVHAATVSLLRWHGQYELADWWRQQYSGGEYADRLIKRLDAAGLKFCYTESADMRFLEWCQRTRRGAGLFYKPNHSINFVGMDAEYIYLLDNNAIDYPERTGDYERVSRSEFERRWRGYGGFAWSFVTLPPPPTPWR